MRSLQEKGAAFVEFVLVGLPLMFIMISIFQMSLAMWSYVTMAYAVREGARYAATKGQGCGYSGNSCSIAISNIVSKIESTGLGLDPSKLNVTFSASDGTTVTCSPLNSCSSSTTTWPPSTANTESSSYITVSGSYPITVMFARVLGVVKLYSGNMQASSRQYIQF